MNLQEAISELDRAAEQERIEPDSTLGVWVKAQRTVLIALYRQEEDRKAQIQSLIDNARATAEARAREAQAITRRMEVQQKDLETKTVASLTKEVAAKLETVLVIRERRWNRQHRHLSHGAVAAAALAIMLGGYIWRGVQDSGAHATAIAAWEKCLDTAFVDKASGKPFCQIELTKLPPPIQRLLAG